MGSIRIFSAIVVAALLTCGVGASTGLASASSQSTVTATDLGVLGGTFSFASAVSPSGQVVGESTTAGNAAIHAFSWTQAGGMVDLGTLGGDSSAALGVNARGQVVGSSDVAGFPLVIHAFSWTKAGGMVDLGGLGGTFAQATAVNARGDVIGNSVPAGDIGEHATLWHT